ncbi:protein transport protein SEC31-like [Schistocerca gregaria]|uniref:protein transport protein SEC31-like n=1 Tax=Schistocerca gregaria TaxID=7010 RepID=UPI00211E5933|nr:protein transport protein SEC31-like [Schistocerca gregaria]
MWKNSLYPEQYPYGIVFGGSSNGSICIWNPAPIVDKSIRNVKPLVVVAQSHCGPVYTIDCNPNEPTYLASGSDRLETFIWICADPSKPVVHSLRASKHEQSATAVKSVAFNPVYKQILASGAEDKTMTIWDLRKKRPAIYLSDPSGSFCNSTVAWRVDQPMYIAAASSSDESPLIRLWDLRFTMSPNATFAGHRQGVTSMSWSRVDSSLLLSTGKDSQTICWDANTGQLICEVGCGFEGALNCANKDVQWSAMMPTLFSVCSSDRRVQVYSLQDFENKATPESIAAARLKVRQEIESRKLEPVSDGDGMLDIINEAIHEASENAMKISRASREVRNGAQIPIRPPEWIRRRSGVSFDFRGVLWTFCASGGGVVSRVRVEADPEFSRRASVLEAALGSDVEGACARMVECVPEGERGTWELVRAFLSGQRRQATLARLGLDAKEIGERLREQMKDLPDLETLYLGNESESESMEEEEEKSGGVLKPLCESANQPLFVDEDVGHFEHILSVQREGGEQLGAASLQGTAEFKFSLSPGSLKFGELEGGEAEVCNAMVVGELKTVVEWYLRKGSMADALMVASMGGQELWSQVQEMYFRQNRGRLEVALMHVISGQHFSSFVDNVELENWKEGLAVICTYAPDQEFESLCARLGDRLVEGQQCSAAETCYVCAGALEKASLIWVRELESCKGDDYVFKLQMLIAKYVILASVVSRSEEHSVPLCMQLKYTQYALILVSQGQLETAVSYLAKVQRLSDSAIVDSIVDRVYYSLPADVARSCFPERPKFPYQVRHVNLPLAGIQGASSAEQSRYQRPPRADAYNQRAGPYFEGANPPPSLESVPQTSHYQPPSAPYQHHRYQPPVSQRQSPAPRYRQPPVAQLRQPPPSTSPSLQPSITAPPQPSASAAHPSRATPLMGPPRYRSVAPPPQPSSSAAPSFHSSLMMAPPPRTPSAAPSPQPSSMMPPPRTPSAAPSPQPSSMMPPPRTTPVVPQTTSVAPPPRTTSAAPSPQPSSMMPPPTSAVPPPRTTSAAPSPQPSSVMPPPASAMPQATSAVPPPRTSSTAPHPASAMPPPRISSVAPPPISAMPQSTSAMPPPRTTSAAPSPQPSSVMPPPSPSMPQTSSIAPPPRASSVAPPPNVHQSSHYTRPRHLMTPPPSARQPPVLPNNNYLQAQPPAPHQQNSPAPDAPPSQLSNSIPATHLAPPPQKPSSLRFTTTIKQATAPVNPKGAPLPTYQPPGATSFSPNHL